MIEFTEQDIKERDAKLARIPKVSDELYSEIIPAEMKMENLDEVFRTLFGVDVLQIYLERNVINAETLLLSEFSTNGFFWAQIVKEMQSTEYGNLYELMNSYGNMAEREYADLKKKWCIARFQGEWFRAYIKELLPESKLSVFFIDYGTSAIIKHSETCKLPINCSEEEVWQLAPLSIPCIIKDITNTQFAKLKKLLYPAFNIRSIKLIEKNCVFEVELEDEDGKNLLEIL